MVSGRLYEPCEHWLRGASGSSQHQSEVAETGAGREAVRLSIVPMMQLEKPKKVLWWRWVQLNILKFNVPYGCKYLLRKCLRYDLGIQVPSQTVFGSIGICRDDNESMEVPP